MRARHEAISRSSGVVWVPTLEGGEHNNEDVSAWDAVHMLSRRGSSGVSRAGEFESASAGCV